MGRAKRSTRNLTVNGRHYRWHIPERSIHYGGGVATLTYPSGVGVLHHYVTESPSPREACDAIVVAIKQGWNPETNRRPMWILKRDGVLTLSNTRSTNPFQHVRFSPDLRTRALRMTSNRQAELFFELFSGLPRQGPGDPQSTLRALATVRSKIDPKRILDIGCGTGAAAFVLAHATHADVTAIDTHLPFLDLIHERARREGLESQVHAEYGDMRKLPYGAQSFDLLWSEGSAYVMGFDAALEAWKPLLTDHGCLVISDLCWLVDKPSDAVVQFFDVDAPGAADVATRRAAIQRLGYILLDEFVLPDASWWTDYYGPLSENLSAFRARHRDDPTAQEIAAQTQLELDLRRDHAGDYGYVFFVMQKQ